MSRRSLILCLIALAAMVVMIVAAVAFLYRDQKPALPVGSRYKLAYAVPSNAVMTCFLSDASKLSSPALSTFDLHKDLAEFLKSDAAGSIGKSPMAVSLHYSGTLAPMYIFDAGEATSTASAGAEALVKFAQEHGYQAEVVDCSELAPEGPLSSNVIVLMAKTKTQISIAKSHLSETRSIMDTPGFVEAAKSAPADAVLFSYGNAKILYERAALRSYFTKRFPSSGSSEYSATATFFNKMAQWGVLSLDEDYAFDFVHEYVHGSDFMSVMSHEAVSISEVSSMLPSYTRFALTLPMSDASEYLSQYSNYMDAAQKRLDQSSRKFIDKLAVKEVASASFLCGEEQVWVNLMKIDRADTALLRGTGDTSFGSSPKVRPYAFSGKIASVFGKVFRLSDESHFAYMNGWLITGSSKAVHEYVSGSALSYNLKTYIEDTGEADLFAKRVSSCVIYVNVPKGDKWLSGILGKEMFAMHDALKGEAEYSPVLLTVFNKKGVMHTDLECHHLKHNRSRAPMFERDTVITVPTGPFEVINSGSGEVNLFYQQKNGAICLKEKSGKGIWGVPFKKTICGMAQNVDYYANGKLQILFAAGSELYLIDRFGRFVNGFPVDLGKDIVLGPAVYDFNGVNSYNVLVLHKDNTVEMYNLHGKKPDAWKGITCEETIKSLPERIVVGDTGFWVVRTSIQTLIYPFYGGEPLNSFKGDEMILPNATVKVKNPTTLEAECYDGKVRAVKIK